MSRLGKVPCTILTGLFGSGKTTLLNHILQSHQNKRIAVIENELGEVGIDDMIVQANDVYQAEEEILEASCGCLCRTVRGDLIRCLRRLKKRSLSESKPLDHILIETTGLADPAAVVQTFFADEFVAEMCSLDSILTLVDAKRLMKQLGNNTDESVENEVAKQLAYADMVLLTKTDLVEEEALMQIKTRIRAINPSVSIKLASNSQLDMKSILNIDAWSLDKVMDSDEGFLDDTIHNVITCHLLNGLVKCFNMAGDEVFASHVPPEEKPFGPWLWRAAKEQITKGRLHLVQTNGDDIWLEPLQPLVSSVGIDILGEIDKKKFDQWISELLRGKNENLFRYKGILALQGQNTPFIFQGMQTRLTATKHGDQAWLADDQRRCKIHVMGNNLSRDELLGGFMACLVQDSEKQPVSSALNKNGASCSCQ
jgi:G3E family GTPase